MVRISSFHGDVIFAWLCVVICTYALAGARGVSVCHRAFVRALVLSICGSLSRTLWSRFVESCRDLMFS